MGAIIDQINLFSVTGNFFGVQLLAGSEDWTVDENGDPIANDLDGNFNSIMVKLNELIDSVWKWVIIGLAAVVALWGAYIGIRIAIAHRNEDKINSRDMLKNLLIGVIVIFVVAMGVPLIIKALYAWL